MTNLANGARGCNAYQLASIRRSLLSSVGEIVFYIDTIEVFFRQPPKGLRTQVEAIIGKRAHIEDIKGDGWQGARLIVQQPSRKLLRYLDQLRLRLRCKRQCSLTRVHFAYDFITSGKRRARALKSWLKDNQVQRYRRKGHLNEYEGTTYTATRTANKNIAGYSDKSARTMPGNMPCHHHELRLKGQTLRRQYRHVGELLDLNPATLLQRNIRLFPMDQAAERLTQMKELAAQRMNRRYGVDISLAREKVAYVYSLSGTNTAQGFRDYLGRRAKLEELSWSDFLSCIPINNKSFDQWLNESTIPTPIPTPTPTPQPTTPALSLIERIRAASGRAIGLSSV